MTTTLDLAEDRVRKHTDPEVNRKIDEDLASRIRLYAQAPREEITRRIDCLDREWDVERLLQTNAASLALASTLFGLLGRRRWLVLTVFVTGFLLQHALQGWCPPVPALRRLGVRTRLEIAKERYALKALRGDFSARAEGEQVGEQVDTDQLLRTLQL